MLLLTRMGICWGDPRFPTPTHTGSLKSKLELTISSSASSGEEDSLRFTHESKPLNFNPFADGLLSAESNVRKFNFDELKAATGNFGNRSLIGEGGFGKVYKGLLKEQKVPKRSRKRFVAVKKLNEDSIQGYEEWKAEVIFLGNLKHPNIAKLLGYCFEGSELLLVYEFVAKGSLNNHLFGRGSMVHPLAWDTRLRVAIGSARGLAFLHTSEKKVIYRDVKSSNILIDACYNAKLSDFGLAKFGPPDDVSHVTTRVIGTYGYGAPEYIATGHLSLKSDVYSFGVMLLEILTGSVIYDRKRSNGKENLLDWAKPRLLNEHKVISMCDLKAHYPPNVAWNMARVIRECTNTDPKRRPSMSEVVETLEKIEVAVDSNSNDI